MATASDWFAGARPRTLPAAVAPVLAGTGVAGWYYEPRWLEASLALVVALALQVAVNYANDYSDGIRGTDDDRVGPMRLVGSGRATPAAVKRAMLLAFGVAGVAGLALVAITGTWWLIGVGAVCIAAAWFYTGGSKPYGYLGLGEVMVFVFFGLVATVGTTYVQTILEPGFECGDACMGWGTADEWPVPAWFTPSLLAGIAIGALACAILVANNLRDIPTDIEAHKMTLAVRLGDRRTRLFYAALIALALVALLALALTTSWWALCGLAFLPPAAAGTRTVLGGATGPGLIPVLQSTGMAELILGAGVFIGLLNA